MGRAQVYDKLIAESELKMLQNIFDCVDMREVF